MQHRRSMGLLQGLSLSAAPCGLARQAHGQPDGHRDGEGEGPPLAGFGGEEAAKSHSRQDAGFRTDDQPYCADFQNAPAGFSAREQTLS